MIPDWLSALVVGAAFTIVGWIINRGFTSILDSLQELRDDVKAMSDRQSKIEKDCITWADYERERLKLLEHDRRITIIETTCSAEHKRGPK